MGDFLFGSDPEVKYSQSPQQQQVFSSALPAFTHAGYQIPLHAGNMEGGWFAHDLPSISGMMPTKGWFDNLDPMISAGLWEPWNVASKNLTESLGYSAGSPRGGASGVLGTAQSNFWNKAASTVGPQAYNMMYAPQAMQWQADLARRRLPFDMGAASLGQSLPQPTVVPGKQGLVQTMLGTAAQAAPILGFGHLAGVFGPKSGAGGGGFYNTFTG